MTLSEKQIKEAATEYSNYVVQKHTPINWSKEELKDLVDSVFMGSYKFAISKLETTPIDFAKWISQHELNFQPSDIGFIGVNMQDFTVEELFEQYLKETKDE